MLLLIIVAKIAINHDTAKRKRRKPRQTNEVTILCIFDIVIGCLIALLFILF